MYTLFLTGYMNFEVGNACIPILFFHELQKEKRKGFRLEYTDMTHLNWVCQQQILQSSQSTLPPPPQEDKIKQRWIDSSVVNTPGYSFSLSLGTSEQ